MRSHFLPSLAALLLIFATYAPYGVVGQTGESLTSGPENSIRLKVTTADEFGAYLTDKDGHAIYMFSKDDKGLSRCTDACLKAWPPVRSAVLAEGDGGVDSTKIGSISQIGGDPQVTYNGRPLYFYTMDRGTTGTSGQNVFSNDGDWFLLSPSGEPIKAKRKGQTSAP